MTIIYLYTKISISSTVKFQNLLVDLFKVEGWAVQPTRDSMDL